MIETKFKIGQTVYWLASKIYEGKITRLKVEQAITGSTMADSLKVTKVVQYALNTGHGNYMTSDNLYVTKKEAAEAFMKANGLDCGIIS